MLIENKFRVVSVWTEAHGERDVVGRPPTGAQLLTRDDAINLAAWLIVVADRDGNDHPYHTEDVLGAVLEECGA